MDKKIFLVIFATFFVMGQGEVASNFEATNYDLSRQVNSNKQYNNGFSLREFWDFLLGGGYGTYPNYAGQYPNYGGQYPNYPTGPGLYPGNNGGIYGGNYPGNVAGPPGAHPGCPLCDSSVYSYCSHKQAHDSCCCENPANLPYNCRKSDCKYLYANTCQEYNLISSCCCIDLQKNSIEPVAAAPLVG